MDDFFSNLILKDLQTIQSFQDKGNQNILSDSDSKFLFETIQKLLEAGEEGSLCIRIKDKKLFQNIPTLSKCTIQFKETNDGVFLYFQKNFQIVKDLEEKVKNFIKINTTNTNSSSHIREWILELEKKFQNRTQNPNFQLKEKQKEAILNSIQNSFHIITGGPGTGKSTIIAFVLEALHHLDQLPPVEKIALSAPTGKAAQRLTEAVLQNLDSLSSQIPNYKEFKGKTLHSLLRYNHHKKEFYYNKERYLPYNLIIVDEASMIDIYLFHSLLEALPDKNYKLILLGDPNQLPSVEKGAVLKDILREIESYPNSTLCTQLIESNRHSSKSGKKIYQFSCEVLKGNSTQDDFWKEFRQKDPSKQLIQILEFVWQDGLKDSFQFFKEKDQLPDAKTMKDHLTRCVGLTFYRSGFFGVEWIHKYFRSKLFPILEKGKITYRILSGKLYYPGLPILITQNDPSRKLFNGDTGFVLSIQRELRGCFIIEGEIHDFALDTLPPHEEAYFLTVHKSQGSEYDKVYLYIPPPTKDSPVPDSNHIFNREILYTGITRAKESLILLGSKEGLEFATQNKIQRETGFML